ncbi:MAG TPA: hypothetical protein VFS21_06055 [Roseiflexaceae bacterium]|nr:hypothetical protein [Roseiflexaceae bacterium]
MPGKTTALPTALHQRLKEDAQAHKHKLAAHAALKLTEQIAAHKPLSYYLTDPRITTTSTSDPTVHLPGELVEQIDDLVAICRTEFGRSIPRGQLIQGLLWDALAPLPPDTPRSELPPPATQELTVGVAQALNQALRKQAFQRGVPRDQFVDQLVRNGLATLAQTPKVVEQLVRDNRVQPGDGDGSTTLRVARDLDQPLAELARQHFEGVRSYAVEALLWWALDELPAEDATDERSVPIADHLYTAVAQHLDERRDQGDARSVRAFVEEATFNQLAREQDEAADA